MKELTIISGKGGTGKTSLTAALADLADDCVIADCDVDAANLHLLLAPQVDHCHEFISGTIAVIDEQGCTQCGECQRLCRFGGISATPPYTIQPSGCEGCGVCARFCPQQVITMEPRRCGEWYQSHTEQGAMIHARLDVGAENSGKLVSLVREQAHQWAKAHNIPLLLIDGPPGIGCPVIASITGADHVLIVTEPTLSGLHDMERIIDLLEHFSIPGSLCINRWDINPNMTRQIRDAAARRHVDCVGLIPFDRHMVNAQLKAQPVVRQHDSIAAMAIRDLWNNLNGLVTVLEPSNLVPKNQESRV